MKKLTIKKENTITDISTWLKYAEPEGGKTQWKEGRSAMEFARYMTSSHGLPREISDYLQGIGIKGSDYTCYPEHITIFPSTYGKGSGRHHDALLIGKSAVVGIEAKVSEPFDKEISKWIGSGTSVSSKENRTKRILESVSLIQGARIDCLNEETEKLMYQLVSSTVGTILEAGSRDGIKNAVVLVIEFTGDIDDNGNRKKYMGAVAKNARDYDAYIQFLGLTGKEDCNRKISVSYGQKNITVWFKKLTIKINKRDYLYSCR